MANQVLGSGEPSEEPCIVHEYALKGPQVEPHASYWMFCSKLHIVTIDELLAVTEDKSSQHYFPPYPDPCSDDGKAETEQEIQELVELAKLRDEPCALVNDKSCKQLNETPCQFDQQLPKAFGCRRPLSKFLNLTPPPSAGSGHGESLSKRTDHPYGTRHGARSGK